MYCKAAQRIFLHKYCFLKQFPFDFRFINAFLESAVSNFPSQISKISAHILVFFFYSSIVESTITIVDFFKTPIVEIYSTIVEKKTMLRRAVIDVLSNFQDISPAELPKIRGGDRWVC